MPGHAVRDRTRSRWGPYTFHTPGSVCLDRRAVSNAGRKGRARPWEAIGRLFVPSRPVVGRSAFRGDTGYLAEATRSLVAVCLAPSRDRLAEAQAPVDATLLARARRLIDGRLGDRSLPCEMLCAELGVSRSRLYRLLELMAELPPTFESSGCCEHAMRCPIWRIRGRYPASRSSGVSWTLPHTVAPSGMNSAFRRRKRGISDGQAWLRRCTGLRPARRCANALPSVARHRSNLIRISAAATQESSARETPFRIIPIELRLL